MQDLHVIVLFIKLKVYYKQILCKNMSTSFYFCIVCINLLHIITLSFLC